MKVTIVKGNLTPKHKNYLEMDSDPLKTQNYRTHRDMEDILQAAFIPFDFFRHLQGVYNRNTENQVEVLEGGCGYGSALVDLKRGITFTRGPKIDSLDPLNVIARKERMVGEHFEGLGSKIRTTGVTLSRQHADIGASVENPYGIDEMIVGPIEHHTFDRTYDFILDFLGAAFYFPEKVIPVYSRILKQNGVGYIRLLVGTSDKLGRYRTFITSNGLEVLHEGGSSSGHMDFVVKA